MSERKKKPVIDGWILAGVMLAAGVVLNAIRADSYVAELGRQAWFQDSMRLFLASFLGGSTALAIVVIWGRMR